MDNCRNKVDHETHLSLFLCTLQLNFLGAVFATIEVGRNLWNSWLSYYTHLVMMASCIVYSIHPTHRLTAFKWEKLQVSQVKEWLLFDLWPFWRHPACSTQGTLHLLNYKAFITSQLMPTASSQAPCLQMNLSTASCRLASTGTLPSNVFLQLS